MQQATQTLLILSAVTWATWDVIAATNDQSATISQVLFRACREHPVIPFVFGVLAGHVFWPLPPAP